jgi:hypothetical protein
MVPLLIGLGKKSRWARSCQSANPGDVECEGRIRASVLGQDLTVISGCLTEPKAWRRPGRVERADRPA